MGETDRRTDGHVDVAFARSYRRESTGSSGRGGVGGESAVSRMRRWTAIRRADDSFDDSVLTSELPSPADSEVSDISSSLWDVARGPRRKDSGFRSIDTQSSCGAGSRKSSTTGGGPRRQSIQTSEYQSIPFVANPFELPGRASCRPAAAAAMVLAGPRSSGRRQSLFTKSDEVGGGDGDWLNEWLRWRSTGCADDTVALPRHTTTSSRHAAGVWNSLSDKVERTFEGFDRAVHRATALLHERRMSSDSDHHIDC